MGLEKSWNIPVGSMPKGPLNKIADVPGVTVGHCTLREGNVQTGVTAIKPHQGNLFKEKLLAAAHVINGFGKSVGLVQIDELGTIETPILMTNTLSVGTVSTALVRYMLGQNEDIGDTTGSVNPVVFECNDSDLNDIRGLHVREEHALQALESCCADFEEGAVGSGRGMRCHELKGGIGSASRIVALDGTDYVVGTLCMTNHALYKDLTINGDPVGRRLPDERFTCEDKGSVITVIATDIPLSERQLKRISRRALAGLSRTGSHMANGSGEIAMAFTTANRMPHYPAGSIVPMNMVNDSRMDAVFRAVIECVEESVLSSMLHAEAVTGRNGLTIRSLRDILSKDPGYSV